jgi:hypothetical protein
VFLKAGLAVNKEVYTSKCLPVLHTFIQKNHKNENMCSGLIWRLHTTQRIRWSEELKIEYDPEEENPPTSHRQFLGELEKEGLQQQLSSKSCKVLDGKDQKRAEVH